MAPSPFFLAVREDEKKYCVNKFDLPNTSSVATCLKNAKNESRCKENFVHNADNQSCHCCTDADGESNDSTEPKDMLYLADDVTPSNHFAGQTTSIAHKYIT